MSATGRWSDLVPRLASAVVLVVVGGFAMWQGGIAFSLLLAAIVAAMTWELVTMVTGNATRGLLAALVAGFSLLSSLLGFLPLVPGFMAATVVVALLSFPAPATSGLFVAAFWLAGLGLNMMREESAMLAMIVVAIVVATDIMGYFAGRVVGGPKFWPKVSPKKTWSGVVAGWLGAALVAIWGAEHLVAGGIAAAETAAVAALVGVLLSFASQLGDIVESALKRRVGVKDASNLIPGHGGFMDRFDGVIGAALPMTALLFSVTG